MYVDATPESFDCIEYYMIALPELKDCLTSIEENLNLKLWDLVSEQIILLLSSNSLTSEQIIEIYIKVVSPLEKAFNPMKILKIISKVCNAYTSTFLK